MRKRKADTLETRRKIIASAARLFRERGPDRVSVLDVMQAAGMTHGGFYKHFESKDALYAAAIAEAFAEKLGALHESAATDARAAQKAYGDNYLTLEHVDDVATGCPIAGMTADALRSSPEAFDVLSKGAEATIACLSSTYPSSEIDRTGAIRSLSLMVGGLILARAVSNTALREEILDAVRG